MTEMLEGEASIWDTVKDEKLSTFVSNNMTENVTPNNLIKQVKHKRKLLAITLNVYDRWITV